MAGQGCVLRKDYVPARLVVKFEKDVTPEAAERILSGFGLAAGGDACKKPRSIFKDNTVLEVGTPYGEEGKWKRTLRQTEGIESAEYCVGLPQ